MTQRRIPHSFADAMIQVAARLGWDGAGRAVDRRERLLRRWSEPHDPRWPSLPQALALDAAFCADGGEEPPFLTAFAHLLQVERDRSDTCFRALIADVATVATETGEAVAFSLAVAQPGASPHEYHRAMVEARQAHSATGRLLRRLHSFLPLGAGSGAGKTGGSS